VPHSDTNQPVSPPSSQPQQNLQTSTVPVARTSSEPTPPNNPMALIEKRRKEIEEEVKKGLNEWRTPIEFYGKVVDENTNPVVDAEIEFDCNDTSPKGTSFYHSQSDLNGLFSIRDIQGKIMGVKVTKKGYYASRKDNNNFEYGDQYSHFVPKAGEPVIFHLRKRTEGEPLVHFHKSYRVPRDGTPIEIDLETGLQTSSGRNALRVECWTQDAGKKSGEKYDWKCRISIVEGQLQLYKDEFPFTAPELAYVGGDEIDMTVKQDVRWESDVERHYFIKTADGKYGRIVFGMVAGGDHFCVVDSYFNPTGSRNLEPK
jgi:hypothetical protein